MEATERTAEIGRLAAQLVKLAKEAGYPCVLITQHELKSLPNNPLILQFPPAAKD